MRLKRQLLIVAAAYCGPKGRSVTRVSTVLFGSGKRLKQLGEGADTATERAEDALAWFWRAWPPGQPWPEGVPRPVMVGADEALGAAFGAGKS